MYVHRGPGRPDLRCRLALPPDPGPRSRLLVVLHGTERNAAAYRDAWRGWAAAHDRVVVCPEFDRAGWPGARGYAQGGVVDDGGRRPPARWALTAVTTLAAALVDRFGMTDPRFDLWGHSAGAQFVHRHLLLCPDAPVRRAVAANAGWYTRPLAERYPFGTGDLPAERVRAWTRTPLVLMRGDRDTERDPALRVTPRVDRQGPHRYARAAAMLAAGRAADPGCRWELRDVPGVAHDFAAMARAAGPLLADESPVIRGS